MQRLLLRYRMLLMVATSLPSSLSATTLKINGWHLPIPITDTQPPDWLGHDSFSGRLTCPPLSYLDLSEGKSKPLLVKSIREQPQVVLGQIRKTWVYEMRTGIFFWDETPVTAADVADFLRQELPQIINKSSGGIWQSPEFQVRVLNQQEVQVQWEGEPPVGPYVVNHFPFFRPKKTSYQCAGVYKPEISKEAMILLPVKAYKKSQPNLVFFPEHDGDGTYSIRLQIKSHLPKVKNPPETGVECQLKAEAPLMSLVFWNPASTPPALRAIYGRIFQQAMTPFTGSPAPSLLPAILQHELDPAVAPSTSSIGQQMLALGYTRNHTQELLKNKEGRELKLIIKLGASMDADLLTSLQQAFLREGIALQFVDRQYKDTPDAFFSTTLVPIANQNYLPFFHSRSRLGQTLTWRYQDPKMDELLEAHLLNSTQEEVHFDKLQAFAKQTQDITPFTVALRYELCVNSSESISENRRSEAKHLNFSWFRNLIL